MNDTVSGPAADTLAIKSRNGPPQRILIKVANSTTSKPRPESLRDQPRHHWQVSEELRTNNSVAKTTKAMRFSAASALAKGQVPEKKHQE